MIAETIVEASQFDAGRHRDTYQSERRLSVVLAAWAPFHAGAEVAAERLAVGLREAGHEVAVIVGTEGVTSARMRDCGLDVRFVPLATTDKLKWWRYRKAQRQLRRELREIGPDVIHANDLPSSQMVGEAAAQLAIPRVCHHRWIFQSEAIDWLNKFGAERHLFVSRALMDELCSASPQLSASQRAVVYDGLPLPAPPSADDRATSRQALDFPTDKLMVLFAGQIIERKGVADLLAAWKQLEERWWPHAELVLVGDDLEGGGRYRRAMEALANKIGCRAKFMGFRKDVATWITAANLCVVPSHAEPLGNATLEAMAHGRVVVGSNVGGIPEMVVDGETGCIVPPRDSKALAGAIDTLLKNENLRLSMRIAARQRCEECFSLPAHVGTVVENYWRAIHSMAEAAR